MKHLTNHNQQYVIQCQSGDESWYDFRLGLLTLGDAERRFNELKTEKPARVFRVVERITTDELLIEQK